jgi:hypothetical protein
MIVEDTAFAYSYVIDPHRVEVQVEWVGPEYDYEFGGWRQAYMLHIRTEASHYTDNTLRSGVGQDINVRKAWASAVSFLGACDEAWNYGGEASENRDLFPRWVMEIVSDHIDELGMHAYEMEEGSLIA